MLSSSPHSPQDLAQLGPLGQYAHQHTNAEGLALLTINHPLCQAQMSLQGAHIFAFQAQDQSPMLWASSCNRFQPGQAIRGGIPICWPWFGKSQPGFGSHGTARLAIWELKHYQEDEQGCSLILSFHHQPSLTTDWPYECLAELHLHFSQSLKMELVSHNLGHMPMPLSLALHSYFPCQALSQVHIDGLDGCLSREQGQNLEAQAGRLPLSPGIDRVFFNVAPQLVAQGHSAGALVIDQDNAQSAIVWNPSPETARQMGDMLAEEVNHMFCLESGNAMDNELLLQPKQQHRMQVSYRLI